ncbi:MAG: ABC transporter ATP-binding protein [Thermoprotei archaeon]|nr:MAG: ABC transporter ATP-binding protein [Thermoprotei archaeon]
MNNEILLKIEDLYVNFRTDEGIAKVIDGISLSIRYGEVLALMGETGCGKSTVAKSILRLLPKNAEVRGKILFKGTNLLDLPESELRKIRGKEIGMIFQEPLTALNPVFTIGNQMSEMFKIHKLRIKRTIQEEVIELLKNVRIPDPQRRYYSYPFELSGGMRQRVMIAMMLAGRPSLLIADEPTSALDVTIQAQILKLLMDLRNKYNMSILIITHDPGVVAEMADRVAIMYAGQIAEVGPVRDIFLNPQHPYTRGLLRALPLGHKEERELENIPGRVPNLINPPPGCRFHPRCPYAMERCRKVKPKPVVISDEHYVFCHLLGGE